MPIRKANRLRKGQYIGIIALSSPIAEIELKQGKDVLQSLGFRVKTILEPSENYGKNTFLFSSHSSKARAKALEKLFSDPKIGAIITARGGSGCMEMLPYLNWKSISKNPKLLVGFSDSTALLLALYTKTKLVSIHGPPFRSSLAAFKKSESARKNSTLLLQFLKGEVTNPFETCRLVEYCGSTKTPWRGPLLGGNLSMLVSLLGTPWEPNLKGHILFLEEVGEKPYRIHRMLLQLKLSGMLKNLRGVVLGEFKDCDHPENKGPSIRDVIVSIFKDYDYPVLGHISAGHGEVNYPIPLGVKVELHAKRLNFLEEAFLEKAGRR